MKWNKYRLYKLEEGTINKYGDMEYREELVATIEARVASWTQTDVLIFGRELTQGHLRLITPYRIEEQGSYIIEDSRGLKFAIVDVKQLGRFRALILKES